MLRWFGWGETARGRERFGKPHLMEVEPARCRMAFLVGLSVWNAPLVRAAGLTDHVWSLRDVLMIRVPPWPQSHEV